MTDVNGPAPSMAETVRIGAIGGLLGGVVIWIYEAFVWVGAQHLMTMSQLPGNGAGLVLGKAQQAAMGPVAAGLVGGLIHFSTAAIWGVLFAAIWPFFRRRRVEATLLALFYAIFAWIVMHALVALWTDVHPDYFDPNVVIGGFLSHIVYAVPMALYISARLRTR